jgi:putative tricarboxylic transport membrane protein
MQDNKNKHNTDLIAAIFMLAVVVVFWIQLMSLKTHRFYIQLDIIFPQFVLISMMVLSLILLIKSLREPDRKTLFLTTNKKKIIIVVVAGILWVSLFSVLGFIISSIVFITFLTIILEEKSKNNPKKIILSVIFSLIIVTVAYFLFSNVLEVPLPKGFWA